MTTGTTVKRRYPRIKAPKSAVVAWKTSNQQEVSRVGTIALGGLFIRTKNPPQPGSTVQMLIVTPSGHLRVRANVRSVVAGEGMGVAIVSMDHEDRGKLDRWLKHLATEEASRNV
jgi:PilZ domain